MKNVLILDDDRDLRALLRASVAAHGLTVVEASTGAEADELLSQRSVHVVIVDGLLPDELGLTFIERLRSRDTQTVIVFLSAFFRDLKTIRRLTGELDVALVVYKPVDIAAFGAKISQLAELIDLDEPDEQSQEESTEASSIEREMAALTEQFGIALPEKIAELARALDESRANPSHFAHARMLAHKLRGSAGSYGYAPVGDAAGVIEDMVTEALAGPALRRFFWEDIENALRDAQLHSAQLPQTAGAAGELAIVGTKALLVVDDDPDFLRIVRNLSRKVLARVVTAQTAEEALQIASEQSLLGVILDVHLHRDESFSLARKIRDTVNNGEIEIAFASVDGRMDTRVSALEAGGSKFFDKPISEESFRDLVQHFLRLSESRQGRVLIVDDDREVTDAFAVQLRAAGYVVDTLTSADALVDKLEEGRPDVLLLDVNLPRVSGIDVCRALRMSERWELLPILIVTSDLATETRIRAFRAGASDVITKPVLPEELLARVRVQQERIRLLRERADKDPLSGLMLRRAFTDAAQRSLASSMRDKKPLSLVLFDIDHFKLTNDKHGHLVGDQVIAGFGELLRRRFRVDDLRARWGGEEFVLVFAGQNADFAMRSAERLLREFSELRFTGEDKEPFSVTFTAGVASFPEDGSTLAALIRRADEQLYFGKHSGRNRVICSSVAVAVDTSRSEARQ
jgi:diguanylate cyclase (GGDEF)-like protein